MHRDRGVMLPEPGAPRSHFVLGVGELVTQRQRLILGRTHAAQREVHLAKRRGAFHHRKALGDLQLKGEAVELIEHPREGRARIILDRDHCHEPPRKRACRAELDTVLPEAHPARRDEVPEVSVRQRHRAQVGVEQAGQELERLGTLAVRGIVDAEELRLIGPQRGHESFSRPVEGMLLRSDLPGIAL